MIGMLSTRMTKLKSPLAIQPARATSDSLRAPAASLSALALLHVSSCPPRGPAASP